MKRALLSPVVLAVSVVAVLGMLYVLFNIYSYSSAAPPPPAELPAGAQAYDSRFVLANDLGGLMVWGAYGAVAAASCVALALSSALSAAPASRRARVLRGPPPARLRTRLILIVSACAVPVLVLYFVTVAGGIVVAAAWGAVGEASFTFWSQVIGMATRGVILALASAALLVLLAHAVQGAAAALTVVLIYFLVIEPIMRNTVIGYRFLLLDNVRVWVSQPADAAALREVGVPGGPVLLAYAVCAGGVLAALHRRSRRAAQAVSVRG